ncbi:hypothetical protein F4604DRAFT_1569200 [Suillus subluteus]|nr:hypothetical protein F4604DRAFT_1569200 [Suillus subluteus]
MDWQALETIIIAFESAGIKVSQFILTLLTCQQFNNHTIVRDLLSHSNDIFVAFLKHPTPNSPSASHLVQEIYTAEVCRLASKDSGSHFGASSATTEQLEQFNVEDMAQGMIHSTPELWALLGAVLGGGEKYSLPASDEVDGDGDAVMDDSQDSKDNDSYWGQVDAVDLEGFINGLASENVTKKNICASHRSAIIKIVSTITAEVRN